MTVDYIKNPIPKEIDERGGASIRLVNLPTVALGDSIKEAVKGGYVIGDVVLVTKQFQGLVKSMVDGIERDGMARQIGEYLTIYPKFMGPIDLEKGYDPSVNSIKLGVRLLGNEFEIDTENWSFRDVTPGKANFAIDEASSGVNTDEVEFAKEIKITGRDFPAKERLRIRYKIEELGVQGEVAANDFERLVNILSIKAGVIKGPAASAAAKDKRVTFTVLADFNSASKSSNIGYIPYPMDEGVKVKVKVGGEGEDTVGVYGGALAEGSTRVVVDWGDGYVEEVTSLSQLSHKYELPGEYLVRISDDVSEIAFSSPIASSPFASEYAKRILEVESVGEKLKTLRASALSNAANLVNAKFASVDNVLTDVLKGSNAIHYIHFAAANETALKASAGYQADARLGSTSARVKFDM